MATLTLPAYAKINLALYVVGKRPDGYHDIATLIQAIDLRDTLEFDTDSDELIGYADLQELLTVLAGP